MTQKLLRSGSVHDFQPTGSNGQSVFDFALQIRETLYLRGFSDTADCLAIPQFNEEQGRIDWYAPIKGTVTSWAAAETAVQRQALEFLKQKQADVTTLSQASLTSDKAAFRLFGLLLPKIFYFPTSSSLFLIDGKPVITYWGFIKPETPTQGDFLSELLLISPESDIPQTPDNPEPEDIEVEPAISEDPVQPPAAKPEAVVSSPMPSQISAYSAWSADENPDTDAVVVLQKRPSRWRRLLIPIGILLTLIVVLFIGYGISQHRTVVTTSPSSPVALSKYVALPKTLPASSLPLQPAVFTPPVRKPDNSKNALIMTDNQLRAGSTLFLNGQWRAAPLEKWMDNDLAIQSLDYTIKENKGTVSVKYENKMVCKTDVFAGLMSSGTLIIKNRMRAKCSDDSHRTLPTIACKQGENNVAECNGYQPESTELHPLTFRKVNS